MQTSSSQSRAYLFGLTTVLFWSTAATAFKLALAELTVLQLVFYASTVSAVVLLMCLVVTGRMVELKAAITHHWRLSLVSAALNPCAYYVVLLFAYDRLPAQVAQPINYTWAITLSLMSVFFLHQRLTRSDVFATAICYGGVVVISLQGELSLPEIDEVLGITLALLSTLLWAGYWILNIRDPREPLVALSINFLIAVPATGIICWTFSGLELPSLKGLMAATYVGLFEMGFAFICWSTALRLAENTSRVSNLIFLAPFFSLILVNQVLGETLYFTTFIGLICIIGGLGVQQMGRTRFGSPVQ